MKNAKENKVDFKIKINDGFCEWEFGIVFNNGNDLSIDDVAKSVCESLNGQLAYSKLLKSFKRNHFKTPNQHDRQD